MNVPPPAGLLNPDFRPLLRTDAPVRRIASEAIAWGPQASSPTFLDPVAALLCQVFDGEATNAELIEEIVDALDVDVDLARAQLERVLVLTSGGGLLATEGDAGPLFDLRHAQLPQPDW